MTSPWAAILEGFIVGLGSRPVTRTLFNELTYPSMRLAVCFWVASHICILCTHFPRSINDLVTYYCLHVLVYLYRLILLYVFETRMAEGIGFPIWIGVFTVSGTYTVFHLGWMMQSIHDLDYQLQRTGCLECNLGKLGRCFRIGTDASFVFWIILLDSILIWHLARVLTRQHGMQILGYSRNVCHGLLHLILLAAVGFNMHQITTAPHLGIQPNTSFPVVWPFQDLAVLLIVTEFGCRYKLLLKYSAPDTSAADLETARKQLIRASATKNKMLRYLHHELRNNLQRMSYLSENLLKTSSEDLKKSALESIRTCSAYITSTVEDVLTIENFESGTLSMRPRSYDLSELLRSEFTHLEQYATALTRTVEIHNNLPSSYVVVGDPDRLRQIIRILGESCITNSVPKDGCHAAFHAKVNGSLEIEIWASVANLFDLTLADPYTLHPEDQDSQDLSQSVVQRILKAVHGHVVLDASREHAKIIVPVAVDIALDVALNLAPAMPPAVHTRKLNMLVVDDALINRMIMKKLLTGILKDTVCIDEAENGLAATKLVLEQKKVFDIIWMDAIMPVKDGLKACKEIKCILPTTVVIMVSANDLRDSGELGTATGPDDAIVKPVKKADIQAVLTKYH